jgi:hypothetical protein
MTAERRGKWHPSQQQISIAIDAAAARLPIEKAAELLGVGPRTLWIFAKRCRDSSMRGRTVRATSPFPAPAAALGRPSRLRRYLKQPSSHGGCPVTEHRHRHRLVSHGASLASWTRLCRPWRARIYIAGRHISLGYYATREEAKAAHAEAVRERLGERYLKGATHAAGMNIISET